MSNEIDNTIHSRQHAPMNRHILYKLYLELVYFRQSGRRPYSECLTS